MEHWARKGDVPLFLWEKRRRRGGRGTCCSCMARRWPRRRPSICRCPARPILGHGLVRAARLTTPGASTWRVTAAPTRLATSTSTLRTAPTTSPPRPPISATTRRGPLPGLRHLVRERCARRSSPTPSRSASSAWRSTPSCGRAQAARPWRSAQEAAGVRSRTAVRSTAPSCGRSSSATIPGTADDATIEAFADAILALDNSIPNGTYVDMCPNLPLVDPARITVADDHDARPIRRHRRFRRPRRVLQAPAQPRQAPRHDARLPHASFQQKNYATRLPHPRGLLRRSRNPIYGG